MLTHEMNILRKVPLMNTGEKQGKMLQQSGCTMTNKEVLEINDKLVEYI